MHSPGTASNSAPTIDVATLIVDDVHSVRAQIKELLQINGFWKIKTAANGAEAQVILSSEPIQLVIVDWQMNPVDGMELLKFIRTSPKLKSMVVVMLTAESTKERVIDAIKAGIDHYVVKPMTPEHIKTKLMELLTKKKVLG